MVKPDKQKPVVLPDKILAQFKKMKQGKRIFLRDIFSLTQNELFVVGSKGLALRLFDGEWERIPANTEAELISVWGNPKWGTFALTVEGDVFKFDAAKKEFVQVLHAKKNKSEREKSYLGEFTTIVGNKAGVLLICNRFQLFELVPL